MGRVICLSAGVFTGQKRVLGLLELELQVFVNCVMGKEFSLVSSGSTEVP